MPRSLRQRAAEPQRSDNSATHIPVVASRNRVVGASAKPPKAQEGSRREALCTRTRTDYENSSRNFYDIRTDCQPGLALVRERATLHNSGQPRGGQVARTSTISGATALRYYLYPAWPPELPIGERTVLVATRATRSLAILRVPQSVRGAVSYHKPSRF
eukprot:scaffold192233_cov15-Prasinocladus_malaysianus.AAC.1